VPTPGASAPVPEGQRRGQAGRRAAQDRRRPRGHGGSAGHRLGARTGQGGQRHRRARRGEDPAAAGRGAPRGRADPARRRAARSSRCQASAFAGERYAPAQFAQLDSER